MEADGCASTKRGEALAATVDLMVVLHDPLLESTLGDVRAAREFNEQLEDEVSVAARPWTFSAHPSPQVAQLSTAVQDCATRIRNLGVHHAVATLKESQDKEADRTAHQKRVDDLEAEISDLKKQHVAALLEESRDHEADQTVLQKRVDEALQADKMLQCGSTNSSRSNNGCAR